MKCVFSGIKVWYAIKPKQPTNFCGIIEVEEDEVFENVLLFFWRGVLLYNNKCNLSLIGIILR